MLYTRVTELTFKRYCLGEIDQLVKHLSRKKEVGRIRLP